MILAAIILLFSILALGLLALLDRYDAAVLKRQAARRAHQLPPTQKAVYYDAFADRRRQSSGNPPQGQTDRRQAAA
jgi:hypothetical protein